MFGNPWFLILCVVNLPGWSTTVFFLFFLIVVHESLVCSEQLNWAMFFRKILQVLQNLPFSSIFCIFEPFPAVTVWFWDPSFHTEDLRKIIQIFTDSARGSQTFAYHCTSMIQYSTVQYNVTCWQVLLYFTVIWQFPFFSEYLKVFTPLTLPLYICLFLH